MGISPVFANMPVIDVTAIAQAIQQYTQSIQQFQSQLQQWQSEFDRIQKAAKGLSSGNFTQIVSSVASLASQASRWKLTGDLITDTYISNAMSKTADGSYSLLRLMNNSEIFMRKIDMFTDIILQNAEKMENSVQKTVDGSMNVVEGAAGTASGMLGTANTMINMMNTLVKNGTLNNLLEVGNIWNSFATMFDVSPSEYAKIYRELLTDTLLNATSNKARNSSELQKLIEEQDAIIKTANEEIAGLNAAEETNALNQANVKLYNAQSLRKDYQELLEWANSMENAIKEINANQTEYNKKITEAENSNARVNANLEMRNNMDETAREMNKQARQKFTDLQARVDTSLGIQTAIQAQEAATKKAQESINTPLN